MCLRDMDMVFLTSLCGYCGFYKLLEIMRLFSVVPCIGEPRCGADFLPSPVFRDIGITHVEARLSPFSRLREKGENQRRTETE